MPVTKSLATAGGALTQDDIIARLEQAGATLLALRLGYGPAGHRSSMPEPVREVGVSYGCSRATARPAVPSAAAITAMDEALRWVQLIPADKFVLRRICNARCLVSPSTGRHLFTWSRIARLIGAERRAVQRWHQQGIALIAAGLSVTARGRPGLAGGRDAAGGTVRRGSGLAVPGWAKRAAPEPALGSVRSA
jgi:hypothetical protein